MNQAAFRTPPVYAGSNPVPSATRKAFPFRCSALFFQIAFICGPQPMFAASRCAESCISAYPNGLGLAGPARGITRFFIHKMFYYKYQYNIK